MNDSGLFLSAVAAVGFFHTILGPDHTLPIVALSQAGRWRMAKTLLFTFCCGIAHIVSAVLIGVVGLRLGSNMLNLAGIEALRAEVVAWSFILWGMTFLLWGLRKSRGDKREDRFSTKKWGPILFTLFIVGPCEPLLPLLVYPAAQRSAASVMTVVGLFSAVTILTMMATVAFLVISLQSSRRFWNGIVRFIPFRDYVTPVRIGGVVFLLCGIAIKFGF